MKSRYGRTVLAVAPPTPRPNNEPIRDPNARSGRLIRLIARADLRCTTLCVGCSRKRAANDLPVDRCCNTNAPSFPCTRSCWWRFLYKRRSAAFTRLVPAPSVPSLHSGKDSDLSGSFGGHFLYPWNAAKGRRRLMECRPCLPRTKQTITPKLQQRPDARPL